MARFVFVPKSLLDQTLASVPHQGKHLLEPLKSFAAAHKIPLNILEDSEVSNEAEAHEKEGDLWFCLEGEVKFVCGGDDAEIILKPGDWLWIPPGESHQHSSSGTARLAIIKIPR